MGTFPNRQEEIATTNLPGRKPPVEAQIETCSREEGKQRNSRKELDWGSSQNRSQEAANKSYRHPQLRKEEKVSKRRQPTPLKKRESCKHKTAHPQLGKTTWTNEGKPKALLKSCGDLSTGKSATARKTTRSISRTEPHCISSAPVHRIHLQK